MSSRTASPCSTRAESSPRERRTSSSGSCRADTSGSASRRSRRSMTRHACSTTPAATMPHSHSACRATAGSARCAPCSTASTRRGIEVDDLSIHTPDLDDVFFALTGKKGNES